MSVYKVRHTLGDIVAKGTKAECDLVMSAFDKYGIAHKFEIVYPEHHEFELSDELREEMVEFCSHEYAEGSSHSIIKEDEAWRLADFTDHDLMEHYEAHIFNPEEDEHIQKAKKEFSDYLAEKAVFE